MKRMKILILLTLLTSNLSAPPDKSIAICQGELIRPYNQLIYATGKVECNFDTLAYNPQEQATGYFQIRPIRLNDFNKRTGSNYILSDMYDYDIAESVFLYYAEKIGPYDLERIAKNWNGSGKKTIDYWSKILIEL